MNNKMMNKKNKNKNKMMMKQNDFHSLFISFLVKK